MHLKQRITFKENHFGWIEIDVPDALILEIDPTTIPGGWLQYGGALYDITEDWLAKGSFLCMKVPSKACPGDWNYLINPNHILAKPDPSDPVGKPGIYIVDDIIHEFSYDLRLLDRKFVLNNIPEESFDEVSNVQAITRSDVDDALKYFSDEDFTQEFL